jgi:hypothetical protein
MKHLVLILLAVWLSRSRRGSGAPNVCAKGVYRVGCAGPRRAAAVRRSVAPVGVAHPVYADPVYARPDGVLVCLLPHYGASAFASESAYLMVFVRTTVGRWQLWQFASARSSSVNRRDGRK